MSDTKRSKSFLRADEQDDFHHWRLPEMSPPKATKPENLLGLRLGQPAVVAEEEDIRPPTLAEIEAIRQEAEQEGFEAGKTEGHAQGLEAGRLQGLKEGHEEGFRQGQEEGFAQGIGEAKQLLARFEGLLGQFSAPLALLDNEIEQELLALSMSLARQVLLHELKTHPDHLLAALRQGVDCLPLKEQAVKIFLHADDLAMLNQLYEPAALERMRWQLEADPLLTRGELVIDSQRSRVDMALETRIAAALAAPEARMETLSRDARQLAAQAERAPQQTQADSDVGDTKSATVTDALQPLAADSMPQETP